MHSTSPRPHTADALHAYVGDVSGGRVLHRGEPDIGSQIDASQLLKEVSRATLSNAGSAVDDDVLVEPHLVARARLNGNSHPRIPTDVPDLAVFGQVRRDKFVAVQPDPDDRHLRPTIGLEGYEVGQRRTFEHCASGLWNPRHSANLHRPATSPGRFRARVFRPMRPKASGEATVASDKILAAKFVARYIAPTA